MKKTINVVIVLLVLFKLIQIFNQDDGIEKTVINIGSKTIQINNQKVKLNNTPIRINKTTSISVEALKKINQNEIQWNTNESHISFTYQNQIMEFFINKGYAKIDGRKYALEFPIITEEEENYIPLSFLEEKLDYVVIWENSKEKLVLLKEFGKHKAEYFAKEDESLREIAVNNNTSVKNIKKINNLTNSTIQKDQKLNIFIIEDEIKTNKKALFSEEILFFSQKDPKWKNFLYTISGNVNQTIGSSACVPTAMSIIVSNLTNSTLKPMEACDLAIKHRFRKVEGGTKSEYFYKIAEIYGLNIGEYNVNEFDTIYNILTKTSSMAIVLMGYGHFTTQGHYIVVIGGRTINGEKYLEILDPNTPSDYYKNYEDSLLIDEDPYDGFVLAHENLMRQEAFKYGKYLMFK
jgi:LysM repeat protein